MTSCHVMSRIFRLFRFDRYQRFAQSSFRMAHSNTSPRAPLIAVIGSTGTGKSDLAIEIARRYHGEIINADAMQLYQGLPILTNKLPVSCHQGIPHHLLGHISFDAPPWVVGDFKRAALRLIDEIRARGRLPIVVGGTHYYLLGLLVDDGTTVNVAKLPEADDVTTAEECALDTESTERLLERLREVDPVMANHWHPRDRRKIMRSLQIYLDTGRRASDIYAEQRSMKADKPQPIPKWQTLVFWVYSEPEILKQRLDSRVDKMMEQGLMMELEEIHSYFQDKLSAGQSIDYQSGIWQSIGVKQFAPYFEALHAKTSQQQQQSAQDPSIESLRLSGIVDMKTATRQYAKYQVRYIRRNLLPRLHEASSPRRDHVFVLDSTDPSTWTANVAEPACLVTGRFLKQDSEAMPDPRDLSSVARDVLDQQDKEAEAVAHANQSRAENRQWVCDVCNVTSVTEDMWKIHMHGRKHKRALKKSTRRSVVLVEDRADDLIKTNEDDCHSDDLVITYADDQK